MIITKYSRLAKVSLWLHDEPAVSDQDYPVRDFAVSVSVDETKQLNAYFSRLEDMHAYVSNLIIRLLTEEERGALMCAQNKLDSKEFEIREFLDFL